VPIISFDVISFAAGVTRMRFWWFMAATVWWFMAATAVGMAPATFIYSYLGGRAPQYVRVLLVVFGIVIAGGVVAAIVRRRRQGKLVPLSEREGTIEGDE